MVNFDKIEPKDLLSRLAQDAGKKWDIIFVNYEYQNKNDEIVANSLNMKLVKPLFGEYRVDQFSMAEPTRRFAMKFCEVHRAEAGVVSLTLDVLMWKNGAYKIFFDFENPPKRINGDLLYDQRHKKYLDIEPKLSKIV